MPNWPRQRRSRGGYDGSADPDRTPRSMSHHPGQQHRQRASVVDDVGLLLQCAALPHRDLGHPGRGEERSLRHQQRMGVTILTIKASPAQDLDQQQSRPGRRAPRPRRGFPGRPCLPERPGERFCRPCRNEGEVCQQRGADCDRCDELPCSTNDVLFDSPVDDVVTRDATAESDRSCSALRFRAFTRGVRTIRPHPTREKRGS